MSRRDSNTWCVSLFSAGRRSSACCVCRAWRLLTQSHQSGRISYHKANPLTSLVANVCQEEANASCHGKREGPASCMQQSQQGQAHPLLSRMAHQDAFRCMMQGQECRGLQPGGQRGRVGQTGRPGQEGNQFLADAHNADGNENPALNKDGCQRLLIGDGLCSSETHHL